MQCRSLASVSRSPNEIEAELIGLGYRCLHRSADAANYARGDERVDFLYADRPIARRLLAAAPEQKTVLGEMRVVSVEGLIGFKLQGLVNDPRRTQDLEDIRALLRANRAALESPEPHFAADGGLRAAPRREADPYEALDSLMAAVEVLCPVWPSRGVFAEGGRMLL